MSRRDEMNGSSTDIKALYFFITIAALDLVIIPVFLLLGLGELANKSALESFFFYSGGAALFTVVCIFSVMSIFLSKHSSVNQIRIDIHNNRIPALFMYLGSVALSFVFYMTLRLIGTDQRVLQTGFKTIEQSAVAKGGFFTEIGRYLFSIYPAAMQETILAFTISIIVVLVISLLVKNLGRFDLNVVFRGIIFLVTFVSTWVTIHLNRYINQQDILFYGVLPFAIISVVLLIVTKSIFPLIAIHQVNNAYFQAILQFGLLTANIIGFVVIGLIVTFIIIWYVRVYKNPHPYRGEAIVLP